MTDNTGGAAFPHMAVDGHSDYRMGMTLRDYFAGQALSAIIPLVSVASEASLKKIALENGLTGHVTNSEIAASMAYGYAQAMIRERNIRTET